MAEQLVFDFEVWKPIPLWPEYEVSNLGRIRRARPGRYCRLKVGDLLKPRPANNGYPRVTLSRQGQTVYKNVHTLVCEAFHGPKPSPAHEVAHWDGDRANPRADNLRWALHEENQDDRARLGRWGNGRITAADAAEIRSSALPSDELARRFGLVRSTINRIRKGTTWKWI